MHASAPVVPLNPELLKKHPKEYVLLADVNDTDDCAKELGQLLAPRARKASREKKLFLRDLSWYTDSDFLRALSWYMDSDFFLRRPYSISPNPALQNAYHLYEAAAYDILYPEQVMVNLIPYNPGASSMPDGFRAPQHQRVERRCAAIRDC